MPPTEILIKLGVALGLGLLVGMERESSGKSFAGLRTFPLFTLLGAVCGLLAVQYDGWPVAAGLVAVAVIVLSSNFIPGAGDKDHGLTTEMAAIFMYAVGAYLIGGDTAIAVGLGGGTAILLHFKPQLHSVVDRLGRHDVTAIMQFVLLALVILPLLPDRAMGPLGVWNPWKIWLLVVLITGISLGGYLAYKFLGANAGMVLGGVLGGIISSTATTVSYSRQSRAGGEGAGQDKAANVAAAVIMIASAVLFCRVLVLIYVAAPQAFPAMAGPVAVMVAVCGLMAGGLWWSARGSTVSMPEQKNPTELRSALVFAALYALVLVAVAYARQHFGAAGLMIVALLAGMADMDAITLSTADMAGKSTITPGHAWRLVIAASLSNFVFKGVVAVAIGSSALRRIILICFGVACAVGLAVIFLWPV